MVAEGTPFQGILFAGLMLKDGKVVSCLHHLMCTVICKWVPLTRRWCRKDMYDIDTLNSNPVMISGVKRCSVFTVLSLPNYRVNRSCILSNSGHSWNFQLASHHKVVQAKFCSRRPNCWSTMSDLEILSASAWWQDWTLIFFSLCSQQLKATCPLSSSSGLQIQPSVWSWQLKGTLGPTSRTLPSKA